MSDKVSEHDEYWINFMALHESEEEAKEWTPKAEWEDLRCVVYKANYDALKADRDNLRKALEPFGSIPRNDIKNNDVEWFFGFKGSDLVRAKEALEKSKGEA